MKRKGILISLSGLDGCGKSTYINRLAEYLSKEHLVVVCEAMKPADYNDELQKVAQKMQKKLFDVFSPDLIGVSYAVDLLNNYERTILPGLQAGKIVLTHRYDLCCMSFSRAMGAKSQLVSKILSVLPKPDLHFFLDISPEEATRRIEKRTRETGIKKQEKEKFEILTNARKIYYQIIKDYKPYVKIIKAEDSIEQITEILLYQTLQTISGKEKCKSWV